MKQTTTIHNRRGASPLLALAKVERGQTWLKTFANLTQANTAAAQMGAGWAVYGFYPYIVGRPVADVLTTAGAAANDC